MSDELHVWLYYQWKYNNHNKYQKYFKSWISNITKIQIDGFEKMRLRPELT